MANMLYLFALIIVVSVSEVFTSPPKVVVLSFDGFKSEYINENDTPHLFELKKESSVAGNVISIFPTKTFVTHFSVSTGLYPTQHGVYGNQMFDNNGKIIFNEREQYDANLTPIWTENQSAKEGRNSGVMMWPGSKFAFNGISPLYYEAYNKEMSWSNRATKIVQWIVQASPQANLVMAYFEDDSCLYSTKQSNSLAAHIRKIDDTIDHVYRGLKSLILNGELHMIVMSDHGTSVVPNKNVLMIESYIGEYIKEVPVIVSGPLVFIKADSSNYNLIRSKFVTNPDNKKKYDVYKKINFPKHWKLKQSELFDDILTVVAQPSYTFYKTEEYEKSLIDAGEHNFEFDEIQWTNYDEKNHGVFMGIGPSFKKDVYLQYDEFELIDMYPLFRTLLGLKGAASEVQNRTFLTMTVKQILTSYI